MNVTTSETHCRDHRVVLSKGQVEYLLRCHLNDKLNLKVPHKEIDVRWGETSIDSGLGKEMQVVIHLREDLTPPKP